MSSGNPVNEAQGSDRTLAYEALKKRREEWKKVREEWSKALRGMEEAYARQFAELFCCVKETWSEDEEEPFILTHVFGVVPEFRTFRCGGMEFTVDGRTVVVNPFVEGGESQEIRLCEGERAVVRRRSNNPLEPETEYCISVCKSRDEGLLMLEQLEERRRNKA